ncbi:MAG: hypothetical protein K8S13_07505 [Desulfobacula sp.]|uniref:hypothetical protein n=1 Tax=Desulfobacula sp. TaxID=2593537 RepID=UPI0025BB058D|nr:hypothetical protein [Desulfobacula sp.]MCD4719695.1 hypothetical protein [Desulfobacula sp.]
MNKIIVELSSAQPKEEMVSAYKSLLQEYINRRPSGTRLKIAKVLNKNKSFVSQITNPSYSIPVPAVHLEKIFNLCRFSTKERETFLKVYALAHPNYQYRMEIQESSKGRVQGQLIIKTPLLKNSEKQNKIENMIKDYARQLFELVLAEK